MFIVFLLIYLVEVKGSTLPIALVILSLAYIPVSLIGPLVGAVVIDFYGYFRLFVMVIAATTISLIVMEFYYGEMGIRSRLAGGGRGRPIVTTGSLPPS